MSQDPLLQARQASGMNRAELAQLSGTSRTTLSAYEHGQKSPRLTTAQRIVSASGFDLVIEPRLTFASRVSGSGHVIHVPSRLPRLPMSTALATVVLPIHLNWSEPARVFDMSQRAQRARVYEVVLREGTPSDLLTYIDGALLADLWRELVLPRDVRVAWSPLLEEVV